MKKATGRGAKQNVLSDPTGDGDNEQGNNLNTSLSAPDGYEENEDLLNMEVPPLPVPIMTADGSSQRLIISHIEVENFKSYYGKQTIGPFHKNFTAVIGPNGSGKSNVIDSLLFVFGYRASKIRSKKLSVLIHSSTGKDDINSCTVKVYFQQILDVNRDEYKVVDMFWVSRTAYRDNSSRYSLNGRQCHFKEIGKVLHAKGIDLVHNRFLILQGEVEHISLMKPKAQNEHEEGMIEYLEDIIGSSRFKLPIQKLVYRLEKLNEKRSTQLMRLKQAEKDKAALDEPAKAAVLKLIIENAISVLKSKILLLKKLSIADNFEELSTSHTQVLTQLDEAEAELKELKSKLSDVKGEQKKLQKTLEKKQEAFAKLNSSLGEKKQLIDKIENDNKRLTEQCEKLKSDVSKEEKKIADLEAVPEKAREKIAALKEELENAEMSIRTNMKEIEEHLPLVEKSTSQYREEHKRLESELGKYTTEEAKIAGELAVAQEELAGLQREESNQRRIVADLNDQLAHLKSNLETKVSNLEQTESRIPQLSKLVSELKEEELDLLRKEAEMDEQIRQMRVELERCKQSAETFRSGNALLQALMDQKSSGTIKGIYGRLGDLGAINERYDVAISTTCGALDNIVVDCVETAQLCIKFLQREKLGVASFIALDKQQHLVSRMKRKLTTPENALRLFDLIQVKDDKVLPAFYYALNDTLVAENISIATRISTANNERWRVVTLKGEVVESSGAMTGGGSAQKKGRIGRDVKVVTNEENNAEFSPKHIAELSEKLRVAEESLLDMRHRLSRIRKNNREQETEMSRAESFAKNLRTDIEILTKNVETLETQIEDRQKLAKGAAVNPEILKECSAKVDNLKSESDKHSSVTDGIRIRIIELTEKIDDVTEKVSGTYREDLKRAEESKSRVEKLIIKENNAITSNDRNLKKSQSRKADLDTDLAQAEERLKELNERSVKLAEEIGVLEDAIEAQRVEVAEAETAYSEYVTENQRFNAEEVECVKRIDDLKKEVKRLDDALDQYRAKIGAIDTQVLKLKIFHFGELAPLLNEVIEHENSELLEQVAAIETQPPSLIVDEEEEEKEDNQSSFSDKSLQDKDEINEMEEEENNDEGVVSKTPNEKRNKINRGGGNGVMLSRMCPVPKDYTMDEIRAFDKNALECRLQAMEERKLKAKSADSANLGLLVDYLARVKKLENEMGQFQDISKQRDLHCDMCDRLKKQRLQEFMDGFQVVSERLKEMYQMVTLGGDASLDLVDSLDPFSEGVSFGVRPPKKSWKQITNLSGGEKTLASLALVFGLHHFRPTPLYVMDEIDAALDFRNVSIIASYIMERTKNAQFIVISLRNNMFERADRLVGIYKIRDCTSNACIDPKTAEKQFKLNLKVLKRLEKKRQRDEQTDIAKDTELGCRSPIKTQRVSPKRSGGDATGVGNDETVPKKKRQRRRNAAD